MHLQESLLFQQSVWWKFLAAIALGVVFTLLTRPFEDEYPIPEEHPSRRMLLCFLAAFLVSEISYRALEVQKLQDFTVWTAIAFDGMLASFAVVRILLWIPQGATTSLADVKSDAEAVGRGEAL